MELTLIDDHSSILRTIIILLHSASGKLRAKIDKNAPKITKNARKLRFLYIFRIHSLKIFDGGRLRGMASSSPPPLPATPLNSYPLLLDITHVNYVK